MGTLFKSDVHAGLSGIELVEESHDLGEGILLRRAFAHIFSPFMIAFKPAPPGEHHPGPWKSASGGFSFDVNAELHIPAHIESEFGSKIAVARTLLFLLRLSVNPAITLPVFANYPFDTLSRTPNADAMLLPYEIQRRNFPLGAVGGRVDQHAVSWVSERWKTTHTLQKFSPEFDLAVEAIDSVQFIENPALALISLWGALEGLFSPAKAELRFRVSALIASFLEVPGAKRAERQQAIAKLYDKRSAAAHGTPTHEPAHLLQTITLLQEVLIKIIDLGRVPSKPELEGMLFGANQPERSQLGTPPDCAPLRGPRGRYIP